MASINYHRGPDATSAAGPLVKQIENISTDGDVVVMELEGGNADFAFLLSDHQLTIHPAKDDVIDWESGDGCGSYVLKNANFGVSMMMERNPNHWRDDVAWFDSIEMLALVDQNARTTAMVSARSELDEAKREAMYLDMQEIAPNQGAINIPMFANFFATYSKIAAPDVMVCMSSLISMGHFDVEFREAGHTDRFGWGSHQ